MTTTVLAVDDEASIRQMLCDYLRADGFEVVGVADGRAALERLDRSSVDGVLLDLSMPGMSGLEVLAEIRSTHNTAVIVVTARGDEADKILGLGLCDTNGLRNWRVVVAERSTPQSEPIRQGAMGPKLQGH